MDEFEQGRQSISEGIPWWLLVVNPSIKTHVSDSDIPLKYWPEKNQSRKFVRKDWGYEDWIINTDSYCGKILFINHGRHTSWHYHKEKDECFYILEGEMQLFYDWEKIRWRAGSTFLKPGDSFHIPTGMVHQLHGYSDVKLFEFSTHHEDSDSIRLNDDGTLKQ